IESLKMKKCNYHDWDMVHEDSSKWENFIDGDCWGGTDVHYIFKQKIIIPSFFQGKHVVCHVKTGAEDIWNYDNPQFVAYIDGNIISGLDINHTEFSICEKANSGDTYELALFAYSNSKYKNILMHVSIGIKNIKVEEIYYDLKTIINLIETLKTEDITKMEIIKILNNSIQLLDLKKIGSKSFYISVEKVLEYLKLNFYCADWYEHGITEYCVGHTHIDIAWLWNIEQTREKVIRSFASVLYLIDKYPNYKFMSSQAQLYEFVKNDCPEIYEKIKKRVKDNSWEVEGSMWVEADCNIVSGESLVRQILYGKRFFKKEFGKDNRILWLPDVFGCSAALPQIMKKSGIKYFMTTKLSWNDTNIMPNDTVMWQGIDGTEILTHFITTADYNKEKYHDKGCLSKTTYNGLLDVSQVKGCWQRYQNKSLSKDILQCYGYGDGGGGPTFEMLESSKRLERGLPTVPKVKKSFALDFFKKLEKNISKSNYIPKWRGEFYLEYHRGTYTSMAKNKRYNRISEIKIIDAEMISSFLLANSEEYVYPKDKFYYCWKLILLNQFHDILPGTSIKEVYETSEVQYKKVLEMTSNIIKHNIELLSSMVMTPPHSIIILNQLSFARSEIVSVLEKQLPKKFVNKDFILTDDIYELPYQKGYDGRLIFYIHNLPSKGYKSVRLLDKRNFKLSNLIPIKFDSIIIDNWSIDTPFYSIKMNDKGEFISIYDKSVKRELLKEGQRGNVLQVFEDRPHEYEAWNIELYYQEKMWEITNLDEFKIIENGPIRSCIKIKRKFLDSEIIQLIFFYNYSKRIDFKTFVDWNEENLLLKVAFNTDVFANKAVYDIQYGNIERNTHWNTSWDVAKFEVCGHKWADLSEPGFGISLMNDCKYGYDIKDSVMRLTLIKSSTYPNEDGDKGTHEFTYSIYSHKGDFRTGEVVQKALSLNNPLYAVFKKSAGHKEFLPKEQSYVFIDKDNVLLETIKLAEDNKVFVLRFFETYGLRAEANIKFEFGKIKSLKVCDLMENVERILNCLENSIKIEFKPYEIITLMLEI
ncbi:MAG: alpha-mannosidase, partial [Clostridiales bacterium]